MSSLLTRAQFLEPHEQYAKNRHAGLDPASSDLDPGLRRDDGKDKVVGWVKPPQAANPTVETHKAKCWVSLRSTQPTMDVTSRQDRGTIPIENHQCLQSQKGMTLVEVLVAVAILAIGIVAIASMQKTAIMVNMRAFDITEAANIAQSQMEQLVSLPFNDSDLDVNNSPFELTGLAPGDGMTPGYDCIWDPSPLSGGKLIRLAVTANGDTSTCGDDGTCNSCDDGGGSGSSITCFNIVGVKTTKP